MPARTIDCAVLDDDRSGEIVLLHRGTGTLILSDAFYKVRTISSSSSSLFALN